MPDISACLQLACTMYISFSPSHTLLEINVFLEVEGMSPSLNNRRFTSCQVSNSVYRVIDMRTRVFFRGGKCQVEGDS